MHICFYLKASICHFPLSRPCARLSIYRPHSLVRTRYLVIAQGTSLSLQAPHESASYAYAKCPPNPQFGGHNDGSWPRLRFRPPYDSTFRGSKQGECGAHRRKRTTQYSPNQKTTDCLVNNARAAREITVRSAGGAAAVELSGWR